MSNPCTWHHAATPADLDTLLAGTGGDAKLYPAAYSEVGILLISGTCPGCSSDVGVEVEADHPIVAELEAAGGRFRRAA